MGAIFGTEISESLYLRNYTQKFKMTSLTMEARILEALKKLDLLGRPILKFSMNLLSVISVSDQSRSKLEMIGSFMQIVILLKSLAELLSEVNFWWKMVFSMNSSILSLKLMEGLEVSWDRMFGSAPRPIKFRHQDFCKIQRSKRRLMETIKEVPNKIKLNKKQQIIH